MTDKREAARIAARPFKFIVGEDATERDRQDRSPETHLTPRTGVGACSCGGSA